MIHTKSTIHTYGPKKLNKGFTLIELLIAVALALFIVLGLSVVYSSIARTNTEMAKSNDIIENGRVALDLISEDVTHAAFLGGFIPMFDDMRSSAIPTDVPTESPDPCLTYNTTNWTADYKKNIIGIPLQAFDTVPTTCTTLLTNKKANTDILVIRHVNNCRVGDTGCESDVAGKLYFQYSNCQTDIDSNNRYVLNSTGFTLKKRDCTTLESKWKYLSNIYYIRSYAVSVGDGIPTLMRSTFDLYSGTLKQGDAVPLVEGVEGFRVELGVDSQSKCNVNADYTAKVSLVDPATCTVNTANPDFNFTPKNRGDGIPESYVHCDGASGCTIAQLMNTASAKLYVLTRSRESTLGYTDTKTYQLGTSTLGPFNDNFKRHLYQMTVRINNVASRRETP